MQPQNDNWNKIHCCKQHAKEPKQATVGDAGHDFFAAEQKLIQPGAVTPIPLETNLEIPEGLCGKIYPRSGLLKRNFVSCDANLIYQNYRGTGVVLMTNHGPFPFLVNVGDRIVQIVFRKKENVVFEKVDKLSCTACESSGFGSTGV